MILITGATGFLGKTLVEELYKQGYDIRVLVRPSSDIAFLDKFDKIQIAVGDVRDLVSVDKAVAGCDIVIHAAAHFRFWGEKHLFKKTNVQGTHHVCQSALHHDVKRVLYISTIAVMGAPSSDMVITESSLPKPVDPYQCSKLRAEKIVQTYHKQHGMDTIILRLGALYGLHGRYALNRLFFEEFLRGWRVKLDGGKYITFPCFVKDAAHGIESAMRLGKSGEMYNISGESVSHNEFNLLVSRLSNKSTWRLNFPKIIMLNFARFLEGLATITQREPFYPINLQYYVFHNWMVDSQKARDTLGFQSTPLEEGVMQTLAWYKSELGLY